MEVCLGFFGGEAREQFVSSGSDPQGTGSNGGLSIFDAAGQFVYFTVANTVMHDHTVSMLKKPEILNPRAGQRTEPSSVPSDDS